MLFIYLSFQCILGAGWCGSQYHICKKCNENPCLKLLHHVFLSGKTKKKEDKLQTSVQKAHPKEAIDYKMDIIYIRGKLNQKKKKIEKHCTTTILNVSTYEGKENAKTYSKRNLKITIENQCSCRPTHTDPHLLGKPHFCILISRILKLEWNVICIFLMKF